MFSALLICTTRISIRGIQVSNSPQVQLFNFFFLFHCSLIQSMTSYKQLEVQFEEPNPKKWCVPLKEDVFVKFMNKGNFITHKALCEGSLFSPLLFGKFFDPSDAFPLWEFDSDVLLSNAKSSNNNQCTVDWTQTETDYVLKAEIPGHEDNSTAYKGNIPTTPLAMVPRSYNMLPFSWRTIIKGRATGVSNGVTRVSIENGKVLEVSGQLRLKIETGTKDWRAENWWEHGCVRRIELPENADWKKTEAFLSTGGDHKFLEVKIPKIPPNICDVP